MVTFVNALVIRSSEKWDAGTGFAPLLAKYVADKHPPEEVVCDCSIGTTCKASHTNMYDSVFCELKPYAMNSTGVYDLATHRAILDLVEHVFTASTTLTVEWDAHVKGLIRELAAKAPSGGGRRWSTRKNHTGKIRHGRHTYRKHIGHY